MALPQFTLSEMLEAGVHFGHRTFRWNPKMGPYIYGSRNGIHILDLEQTVPLMYQALGVIRNTVARNGRVLFVGTKRQAQSIVAEAAERCGMYYVNHRWLGGTVTNWKTISKSIKRLKELEQQFAEAAQQNEEYEKLVAAAESDEEKALVPKPNNRMSQLTKKERLMQQREFQKLQTVLGGIKDMGGIPDLIIVMDAKTERIAINEANNMGIPVISIVDTNVNPDGITYVIPGNDDASRALRLYTGLFSDAVLEGIAQQVSRAESPAAMPKMAAKGSDASQRETKVKLSPKAEAAAKAAEAEAKADAETKAEESATPAPEAKAEETAAATA